LFQERGGLTVSITTKGKEGHWDMDLFLLACISSVERLVSSVYAQEELKAAPWIPVIP
jgi:hypothetical protein